MKKHKLVFALAFMLCVMGSGDVNASAKKSSFLNVIRDSNGHLTKSSKEAAAKMTKMASRNGRITLWLTLDFDVNLYLDPNVDQVAIAAQNRAIRDGFNEVLDPLVAKGSVWHPLTGPNIRGPGCSVQATVHGLRRLIRDGRIMQIVAVE